ncbi:MAG: 2-polyprenylphenol 6-hydroxylase, partial [Rhodospirillales bacterium]
LARPLIEDWMQRNLGPEAVFRDTVKDVADAVQRLPRMLDGIEQSTSMIVEGRVKLNPETVRALHNQQSGGSVLPILWSVAVVLLVVAAIMKWM